ncbi:MAG: VCBS repeat-containing protein [Archangiaceae bacterium]|nr:VCBS repeat-containing protein [Archangiaceae bacterium]
MTSRALLLAVLAAGCNDSRARDEVAATAAALRPCPPAGCDVEPPEPPPEPPPRPPRPEGTPGACDGASGQLALSAASIQLGQSVSMAWSVNRPSGCLESALLSGAPVGDQGTKTLTSWSSKVMVLSLGGKQLATASFEVVLPMVVHIDGSSPAWRDLMIQALGTPGRTVILADTVDMDLTGQEGIYLRENVTFTSELPNPGNVVASFAVDPNAAGGYRGPARTPNRPGPRLFTNSTQRPLFNIRCNGLNIFGDNVKVNGFRIQGPHPETMDGDENLEQGFQIDSCVNVEIFNMELSGFSGQAIYVVDPLDRQFAFDHVRIHDNYIHNNQHVGGNGYGVESAPGARMAVERNLFDFNRHAIASSGAEKTGYRAHQNLVLAGGGIHDTFFNPTTHQFDVHGDANCDTPSDTAWNCGNAGDTYLITSNSFQYTRDYAVKLRGQPRTSAIIADNFFAHTYLDDAVALRTQTNVIVTSNTVDSHPEARFGVCDFDGDGRDDLFLATGATWWWSSEGRYPWSFLAPHRETLDQVGLGDFNGDGRCDVFAVNATAGTWEIAPGGRGPWLALPGSYAIPFSELAFGDFNGDRRKDVFRRAPDGQWWAISPGVYGWTALQSSGVALGDLRFGDFNGNGLTDVLSRAGNGQWQISWDARSPWDPVYNHYEDFSGMRVANVDGIPGDDLVRYTVLQPINGRWDVASGARGGWAFLTARAWPPLEPYLTFRPAQTMRWALGRFNGLTTASLLEVDFTRQSLIFTRNSTPNTPYGLFSY